MADQDPDRSGKGNNNDGRGQDSCRDLSTKWLDVTVDQDNRIRIPDAARRPFEDSKIKELWLGFAPVERVLIICPPCNWPDWLEKLRKDVGEKKWREIERRDTAILQRSRLDVKGRIRLEFLAQESIQIGKGDQVALRGREKWLELWSKKEIQRTVFGEE